MPVKRRIDKSRKFDDDLIEDLFYGPGTCLINGIGYLGPHGDGFFRDKSPEVQAAILEQMRLDWELHSAKVLAAWAGRSEHDLWIAERHHGSPSEPWAQIKFGEM